LKVIEHDLKAMQDLVLQTIIISSQFSQVFQKESFVGFSFSQGISPLGLMYSIPS